MPVQKRKWTREEVENWRKENPGWLYVNKEDANLFVRKRCGGMNWAFNWGNPATLAITAAGVAVIVILAVVL